MSELSKETRLLLAKARPSPALEPSHRSRLKKAIFAKILLGSSFAIATGAGTAAASPLLKTLLSFGIGAAAAVGAIAVHEIVVAPAPVVSLPIAMPTGSAELPKVSTVPPIAVSDSPSQAQPTLVVSASITPPHLATTLADAAAANVDSPVEASSSPAPMGSANTQPPPQPVSQLTQLQEETSLIRQADSLIRSGNAAAALSLLDQHASRFPTGTLSPERTVQRVLALCALGRKQDALGYAQPLLQAGGPLVTRIQSSCVGESWPRN
jgi:hypothetical protein